MNQLKRWIPVFIWAVLMSSASTDSFSEAHTSKIALPLFRFLLPHASLATLEWLHFVVRKCAHFGEYFIFSLLLLRALIAIAIAAGYSALDEFRQSFVQSRTASP